MTLDFWWLTDISIGMGIMAESFPVANSPVPVMMNMLLSDIQMLLNDIHNIIYVFAITLYFV